MVKGEQYVIMRAGADHNIDYNADGKIDSGDDIVVYYKDGKNMGWRLLNASTKRQMASIFRGSVRAARSVRAAPAAPAAPAATRKRVVYERRPPPEAAPVVIKDNTDFGQYIKAGAGVEVGRVAVDGAFSLLEGLFTGE